MDDTATRRKKRPLNHDGQRDGERHNRIAKENPMSVTWDGCWPP